MSAAELLRLQRLSLVSKVSGELHSHLGVEDKDLAEFVIHLASSARTAAEFHATLQAQGADFTPALAASLFALICKMDPDRAAAARNNSGAGAAGAAAASHGHNAFEDEGAHSNGKPAAKKFFGLAIPDSAPLSIEEAAAPAPSHLSGPRAGEKRKQVDPYASSSSAAAAAAAGDSSARFLSSSSSGAAQAVRTPFPFRQGAVPMVGDIVDAEVKNIKDFGAFVELKGYAAGVPAGGAGAASASGGRPGGPEGLLHMSQITKGKVFDVAEVLKRNQKVKVKVLSIVGSKLSVSMKDVDQTTGQDLKPKRGADGAAGADDLHSNPARPLGLSDPAALRSRQLDDEREHNRARTKRLSSPERWEMTQLLASGAMGTRDRPDVNEETGILGSHEEDEDDEVEVEINDAEPKFLEGQTAAGANMSPIKMVANPEGSLQRAALTQSALSKERRELREQQKAEQLDAVPADLSRSWEDPMARPGERHLAAELRGIGMSSIQQVPKWKEETMGKNVTYGRATTLTIKEQRESLPIYKLRSQLLQAVHDNQVLVVIGETGSGQWRPG